MKEINTNDIRKLEALIDGASTICIVSHIHPDGDAVGSGIGMLDYLLQKGKDARLILPHEYPEAVSFLVSDSLKDRVLVYENSPQEVEECLLAGKLIILQDLNSFARAGDLEATLETSEAKKILIDHHLNPDREKFELVFSETEISSTAEFLYYILKQTKDIDGDVSGLSALSRTALMTGMTTDSNNFANSVYPSTLQMASELLASGIDRDYILGRLYNDYREERLRLMGKLLYNNMKITDDGVAYMILDSGSIGAYHIRDGETEGFVNLPLSIKKVKMSIFIKEDIDRFRVSLRSKKGISSNLCARSYFNGGGHELASGGRLMKEDGFCTVAQVQDYIEEVTHKFMNENENNI